MHCWKTINIEREYGTTRFYLLTSILFVLVFCFSYILFSFNYKGRHVDRFLWLILTIIPFIYPIHKFLHYLVLFNYRKSIKLRLKIQYLFIPILQLRLRQGIPKRNYIVALLTPFIVLNTAIIIGGFSIPQYAHYFSLLLALHCSICLMDFLYVNHLMSAPSNAIIEETPRGYEILVPLEF